MPDFPLDLTFGEALTLAAAWHTGQYRKAPAGQTPSVPYVSHLLGVASIALEYGADQTEAIAALLHDALKDGPAHTGRTPEDLRAEMSRRFGEPVAALVDGATDDTPPPGSPNAPGRTARPGTCATCPPSPHRPCW
ncbi:HD domain-containing protein [Deinococcus caeni]|uniref:HD domain-containing protein n=1 Tax=Deinococcus caeni TaxID=569127 RepID=UPI003617117E